MNADPGFTDVPETQVDSYLTNAGAHIPGIQNEKVIEYYTSWANNYEKDLNTNIYRGPIIAANELNNLLEDKHSKILDVACGTGFVAEYLFKHGFDNLYGLEPSEGMVSVAKSKCLYKEIYVQGINADKPTSLESDSFDCVVIAGGFGEGHIPCEGLKELARLARPKGFVVIVMRKEYLSYVKDYVNRLEPLMNELQDSGVWKQVKRYEEKDYSFNKTGIVLVFEKN